MNELKKYTDKYVLYIAWTIAIAATSGSLIFSEVIGLTPCLLCWYQRIAMYPLVVIIAIGILTKDKKLALYALPFSIAGTIIAFLHNLLQWGLISEALFPCRIGVSCAAKEVNYLGFITIPLLSLFGFLLITICLLYSWRINK